MDYRKLGKALLLVGVLIGAVGVYYVWLRPKIEEKPPPLPPPLPKKDEKPPEIKDLRWEPTRVINGKVYDGKVSLTAEDKDCLILEAYLEFSPAYPLHLPREAFPEETTRRIELKPIDGSFDQRMEQFSANITDIKGGKEYEVKAVVKDVAGNVATASLTIPYIREFESIVLSDYLLGASYMTFWDVYWESSPAGRWKEIGLVYEPILGQYNSRDQIVISKHIDWATGHSIAFFCLDFGWIRPDSPFDRVARECLLTSDLADSINFNIFYHNDAVVGESWSQGPSALYSDFSFLATHYFRHPSYLKVGDKTIVYISNLPIYWKEFGVKETNNLFKDLKNYIKNKYGYELFLAADVWPDADPSFLNDPNLPFDAILNWGNLWHNIGTDKATYDEYADKYASHWRKWASLAEKRGLSFIPLIFPGFDDKPYADSLGQEHHYILRNPEKFRWLLRVAKEVAKPPLNMIILSTWNDFHEGTIIEPTREEGFAFLEGLSEVLSIPRVLSLGWFPLDVRNDKICSIRVRFEVEDITVGSEPAGISSVELRFIPKAYTHLPKEAFPNETIKQFDLKPLDGRFNESLEEFLVNITGIKGGREYDIIINVKDKAGNVATASLTTPYIREFENIAPLDDISVGAFYYPWYNKDDPWFHFWFNESEWKSLGYEASPLLGQYRSDDQIITSKHIDWATGHGIDYFLISWGYAGGPGGFNDRILKNLILKNPLIDQIKFCILYESGGRLTKSKEEFDLTNSQIRQQLLKDFNYFVDNYFSHPSYFEIGDKKVVFFDASRFFVGDVQGALTELRESVKGYQLYLMSDALGNFLSPTHPKMIELLKSFDAVTADDMWCNNYGDPDARRDFVSYTDETLSLWKSYAGKYGKVMVPSINPGWEPYLYPELIENFDAPFLKRDKERYKQLLSIGLKYANHIIAGHFNEFFTHNHIEPDTQDDFTYLKVIREELPIVIPSRVFSNLDNYANDWEVYTEGNPTWIKMNVGSPSRDGSSLKLSISGGSPYSNVHFYRTWGLPTVSRIKYEVWFWFSNTTWNNQSEPSRIQAIEFSCSIFASPHRYEWALQWENVGDETPKQGNPPTWRIWTSSGWSPLEIQAYLTPETWHHLILFGKIDYGYVYYLGFKIDGTYHHLGIFCNPTSTIYNQLAVAVQLDGNYKQDAYDVYVDSVTLEVDEEDISTNTHPIRGSRTNPAIMDPICRNKVLQMKSQKEKLIRIR